MVLVKDTVGAFFLREVEMAVNQIGAGGLQNVNLYKQNQENPSPSVPEPASKSESVEAGKSVTVDFSQESLRLSQRTQVQGVDNETEERQLQRSDDRPVQQTDANGQTNVTNTPQQEKIDLFA